MLVFITHAMLSVTDQTQFDTQNSALTSQRHAESFILLLTTTRTLKGHAPTSQTPQSTPLYMRNRRLLLVLLLRRRSLSSCTVRMHLMLPMALLNIRPMPHILPEVADMATDLFPWLQRERDERDEADREPFPVRTLSVFHPFPSYAYANEPSCESVRADVATVLALDRDMLVAFQRLGERCVDVSSVPSLMRLRSQEPRDVLCVPQVKKKNILLLYVYLSYEDPVFQMRFVMLSVCGER